MNRIESRALFKLTMTLHPSLPLGATPAGIRTIFPVSGGTFEGERVRGHVHPHIGSDLLLTRADGTFQQDVRLLLVTDDQAHILMTYRGVRRTSQAVNDRISRGELVDPSEYYLRIAPFFETSAERYSWLNGIVSVGAGGRTPAGVAYELFEIL